MVQYGHKFGFITVIHKENDTYFLEAEDLVIPGDRTSAQIQDVFDQLRNEGWELFSMLSTDGKFHPIGSQEWVMRRKKNNGGSE